ncbi:MAG: 7-cyano-7-deazaguanine synthase [Clostridia bacterium]|nr:7-cyano-7-deazaguanine synthase [Clostridia bacterium]
MPEASIYIGENKGFPWISRGGVYARGYAYEDGEFIAGSALLDSFSDIRDEKDFLDRISSLNGVFAAIINREGFVLSAVDRYGVFKLFHCRNGSRIFIGDDIVAMAHASGNLAFNSEAEKDWLPGGFVSGTETLFKGIHSLNASRYLAADMAAGTMEIKTYHSFTLYDVNETGYDRLMEGLGIVFRESAERLAGSLEGRKALIPLSGGADSRFCAMMLRQCGYENVLCFTYGNRHGHEERTARRTAAALGFEHVFIPYKRRDWARLFKEADNLRYIEYASQYKATPHFSDLFAARKLAGMFDPSECIIIPGHVGSVAESIFIPGSFCPEAGFIDKLIEKYFYFYGNSHHEIRAHLHRRLKNHAAGADSEDARGLQGRFDGAAYDSYRSNHLFMALKPYEYYGFEWRLPLMDNAVVDFFKTVPLEFKGRGKKLLSDFSACPAGCSIPFHRQPGSYCGKVAKNLMDKRYCCINPFLVFKLRKANPFLPGIPRIIYRFYRNYLCYATARTLLYVKGIDRGNNGD